MSATITDFKTFSDEATMQTQAEVLAFILKITGENIPDSEKVSLIRSMLTEDTA